MSLFKDLKLSASIRHAYDVPSLPIQDIVPFPGLEIPVEISEINHVKLLETVLKDNKRLCAMICNSSVGKKYVGMVGALMRIISFSESDNGKYIVIFKSLTRCVFTDTKLSKDGFYKIDVNWNLFLDDEKIKTEKLKERKSLEKIALEYADKYNLNKFDFNADKLYSITDTRLMSLLVNNIILPINKHKLVTAAVDLNELANIFNQHMEFKLAELEAKTALKH